MVSKLKVLRERIDKMTLMPTSLARSLERLNSAQEQQLQKTQSLSDEITNTPIFDFSQAQSRDRDFWAAMDEHGKVIRDEQTRRENELRDRHKEMVAIQANIVDAINQTVLYQKNLSKASNRVQYAILAIAILGLFI